MADNSSPSLARTMGLSALIIYGVGDMLGSGIYALIGKAAGAMGNAVWLAFLVSMVAALLTGLSYASLGSRYPRAAGAAFVTHRAFGFPFLSYLVGLAVTVSGLTSMATQSRAFTGYFSGLVGGVPAPVIILGFVGILTFINCWGMRESTWLNALCTFIELFGLVIIIVVSVGHWNRVDYFETPTPLGTGLVLQGAVLTFYSFIGFEDMINVAEEVKNPRRNFPIAVICALAIVTVIYMAVSLAAVSVVPYRELSASPQPLVEVVSRAAPAFPKVLFSAIALFAITNTALLNYIMGSRIVYGMARQGFLPRPLGVIHLTRRTPHVAILVLMVIVLALVSIGDISQLASATSVLLLCVFVVINLALIILQRKPGEPKGAFEIPSFIPALGIVVSIALLTQAKPGAWKIAAYLLIGIAVLYFVMRPKAITEESLAAAE